MDPRHHPPKTLSRDCRAPVTHTAVTGRCDACGFRAYVRVAFLRAGGGETALRFCSHHYLQHAEAMSSNVHIVNIDDSRADSLYAEHGSAPRRENGSTDSDEHATEPPDGRVRGH